MSTENPNVHKEEEMNYPLPDWAVDRVSQGFPASSQLLTRDGRKTGNAYLWEWTKSHYQTCDVAVVVTDAGNIMRLTQNELTELFHEPWYTMRPLRSHTEAMEQSA